MNLMSWSHQWMNTPRGGLGFSCVYTAGCCQSFDPLNVGLLNFKSLFFLPVVVTSVITIPCDFFWLEAEKKFYFLATVCNLCWGNWTTVTSFIIGGAVPSFLMIPYWGLSPADGVEILVWVTLMHMCMPGYFCMDFKCWLVY